MGGTVGSEIRQRFRDKNPRLGNFYGVGEPLYGFSGTTKNGYQTNVLVSLRKQHNILLSQY